MKIAILGILFALNFTLTFAGDVFDQVKRNKPSLTDMYVKKLEKEFNKAAKKYNVPADVLAAIAMTESSYKLNAINKHSDDYGIMQVNMWNIKRHKLSKAELLTNLSYSIDAGAMIFQWFYQTYPLHEAIKRYNCGTRKSCIHWRGPRNYLKKVLQYM